MKAFLHVMYPFYGPRPRVLLNINDVILVQTSLEASLYLTLINDLHSCPDSFVSSSIDVLNTQTFNVDRIDVCSTVNSLDFDTYQSSLRILAHC